MPESRTRTSKWPIYKSCETKRVRFKTRNCHQRAALTNFLVVNSERGGARSGSRCPASSGDVAYDTNLLTSDQHCAIGVERLSPSASHSVFLLPLPTRSLHLSLLSNPFVVQNVGSSFSRRWIQISGFHEPSRRQVHTPTCRKRVLLQSCCAVCWMVRTKEREVLILSNRS